MNISYFESIEFVDKDFFGMECSISKVFGLKIVVFDFMIVL